MRRWQYAAAVALALATALNVMADDQKARQEQVEITRKTEENVGLAGDEILHLEEAVKRVEDELRERREFVIRARTAPREIRLNLDAQNPQLQAQEDRIEHEVDLKVKAEDLAWLKRRQDVEREKGAFLGISGTPVVGALREQLRLPRGIGLVVEHVQPKSAAEEAGVKRFDVLHKLDDQLLVNSHQLAVLVRTRKPGDEVKLTVIRGGESKVLTAKLTEAELEPLDEEDPWRVQPFWREKLNEAIRPENQVRLSRPANGAGVLTRVREKNGSEKVVSVDDSHTMILTKQGEKNELRVLSRDGKELFRGPVEDADALQNLPKEVRAKARSLLGARDGATEGKEEGEVQSR